MKKNRTKDQEQRQKPRRLLLSRETIKILDDAALLQLIKGGAGDGASGGPSCTSNSTADGG